jgi:bacterioferritin-associated ferredoxin
VYVCLCNGVTENQIRDAASEGAVSLHELRNSLGVATCCGRCAECALEILEESLPATMPAASFQTA